MYYARRDPRLRVLRRPENLGLTENFNNLAASLTTLSAQMLSPPSSASEMAPTTSFAMKSFAKPSNAR